jgi:glutathione S-transferase
MFALYFSPGSCALGPHIVLAESGAPYELRRVDFAQNQQQSPAFREVNPKGRVPALVTPEGWVLTEAAAIMAYLARTHPEKGLLPTSAREEAQVLEWLSWLSSGVHATTVACIWRATRFSDDPLAHDSIRAKGRAALRADFGLVEEKLNGRSFAVGEQYSIADSYLVVFYRWGHRLGLEMSKEYPAWAAVMSRVAERPAVQRALSEEGITLTDAPS